MSKFKSLKTYSKTQKVVNYSTLFAPNSEPYEFDDSTNSIEKDEQPVKQPDVPETKPKRILRTKKKTDSIQADEEPKPAGKSKTKSKKTDTVDTNEVDPPVETQPTTKRKARIDTKKESIKLFENTNMDMSNASSNKSTIETNDFVAPEPPKLETRAKSTSTSGQQKRTLRSSSSASNIKSGNAKKTKINDLNKENKLGGRVGMSKCSSASNMLKLTESKENNIVKEVTRIKSIMKSRIDESLSDQAAVAATDKPQAKVAKKAVKILENIDDKNDQLANFKFDCRKKHGAPTSTPSGLRRKPLKLPQDVSMIASPKPKA